MVRDRTLDAGARFADPAWTAWLSNGFVANVAYARECKTPLRYSFELFSDKRGPISLSDICDKVPAGEVLGPTSVDEIDAPK